MTLGHFRLGSEEPEPDPIWRVWLPETPWRPPLPDIPELEHWTCNVCGAVGCPVPWCPPKDAGVDHVQTEHADVIQAYAEARASLAAVNEPEPEPEPEEHPMVAAVPDPEPQPGSPLDPMAMAEALNTAVREMSDLLLGACRTLEAEGWTPAQARALVLKTYLGTVPS